LLVAPGPQQQRQKAVVTVVTWVGGLVQIPSQAMGRAGVRVQKVQ
jgi:hypothetical protein